MRCVKKKNAALGYFLLNPVGRGAHSNVYIDATSLRPVQVHHGSGVGHCVSRIGQCPNDLFSMPLHRENSHLRQSGLATAKQGNQTGS